MRSFVIAIFVLVLISVYIFITSAYYLRTEQFLVISLKRLDALESNGQHSAAAEALEELFSYTKKRNKILSLYICRSKCTELEFLVGEMNMHFKRGNASLYRFTASKLYEALRDIHENDAFPTIGGIL